MEQVQGAIIVKVQQSIASSDDKKSVLVYDKARTLFFESRDPKVVNPLIENLGEEPKKYFKAKVDGKELKILEEMENQNW